MAKEGLRALVFDVQGTLLDFYTPVHAAVATSLAERGLALDAARFVSDWRRSYFEGMSPVADGQRAFVAADQIYREGLDQLLARHGVGDRFDEAARSALNSAWTRLVPWPDTVEGLYRLRTRFTLVALSNGGMAATIAMTARHDLAFHAVLTGTLVRNFKPHASVYRLALDSLGFDPGSVMMVASHPYDLTAAAKHGMRAAFVDRPHEFGPGTRNEATAPAEAEVSVTDLHELMELLEAS